MKKLFTAAAIAALTAGEAHAAKPEAKLFLGTPLGAGFMPGIGGGVDTGLQACKFRFSADGRAYYQVKEKADRGYSYNVDTGLDFSHNHMFFGGGLHWSGYRSHIPNTNFDSEAIWESHRRAPMIIGGYRNGDTEYRVRIFGYRNSRPYETSYLEFSAKGRPDGGDIFRGTFAVGLNKDTRNGKKGLLIYGGLEWAPF
jgi:hypothetical protein